MSYKEYHNQTETSIKNFKTLEERPWADKKSTTMKIARSFNRIGYKSRAEQLENCGTFLEFAKYSNNVIKLHNANFCRARMCPMCAWRRSLKVGYQVSQVLDEALKDKTSKLLFLTLTCKNVSADELSSTLSQMFKAYSAMFRLSKVKRVALGAFRALEVTYNKKTNTYHPHLHVILQVPHAYGSYNDRTYLSQREWSHIWQSCMGIDYVPIVDIRKVKPNSRSYDVSKGVAAEVTKGQTLVNENLALGEYMAKGVLDDVKMSNVVLDEVVKTLDNALANRKLVAFRGELLSISKRLDQDDLEDGDLINVKGDELNEQLEYVLLRFRWMLGGYVLLDDENEPVQVEEVEQGPPIIDGAQATNAETETSSMEGVNMTTYSFDDTHIAFAIAKYLDCNWLDFQEFQRKLPVKVPSPSYAEWVYLYRFEDFRCFCQYEFDFDVERFA